MASSWNGFWLGRIRRQSEAAFTASGRPPRCDGPERLPAASERPARRPGRLSGHLPHPGEQGRLDPTSRGGWGLAVRHRAAGRCAAQVEAARRRRHLRELSENPAISRADVELGTALSAETDYGPLIAEIDRLPEQLRSPVVLHYFEGLSTEATAQRLGCPRGTVLSRLSRARSRIKAAGAARRVIRGPHPRWR